MVSDVDRRARRDRRARAPGSGKTTWQPGLMGALREAGHRVAPFKVGPDFIDPGYHALAARRPGRNLDPVLVGDELIGPLYRHGSAGADIAVVEGVMGLFDGRIDRRRHGPGARDPPRTSPACSARRWSSSSTPAARATASPRCCTASRRSIRVDPASPASSSTGSARRATSEVLRQACEHAGVPGARRHPARRRISRSVKASRPGHRRRARPAGRAAPWTR